MSVMLKARLLWVLPVAVIGSWLAVRTLAASTMTAAPEQSPPSLMVAAAVAAPVGLEIQDAALAKLITRHAQAARAARK
jgi:hypothetical protein